MRRSVREFFRRPLFSATVVFTLALGIGVNAVMFTVVHGVLMAPLPYINASELVRIWEHDVAEGNRFRRMATADVADYRERNGTLTEFVAFSQSFLTLRLEGSGAIVTTEFLTPGGFDLLGVPPALGRTFVPEDHVGDRRSAVLSHSFWITQFGGDSSAIGSSVSMSDMDL